jgi:hypothetical protein
MPKNKDLNRLARARMRKTGESYTTARLQLLKKKSRSAAAPAPEPDYAALAGMSDETIRAATGCPWKRWVRALDAIDAATMSHREIAQYVYDKFHVSGWWAQTVTVGYERIKGLRAIGQRRGGSYEASKSRTLPVPLAKLYRAFSSARTRSRWLTGVKFAVRTATPEKSMRVTWEDGTSVELYFAAKDNKKSQVAIQHRKLATRADVDRVKAYWTERLDALAVLLTAR